MARRDVDLVIRARDEAGKAVDAIAKAINGLVTSQDKLQTSAKKTDGTLDTLATSLQTLDRKLRGLSAAGRIAQELDKAQAAVGRLEQAVSRSQSDVDKYTKALAQAGFENDKLAKKTQGALQAQQKQQQAITRSKRVQNDLTASIKQSASARDRAIKDNDKLTERITKQASKVQEVAGRYAELSAAIQKTANPGKTLQRNFDAANKSVTTQVAKLADLRQKQVEARESIRGTATEVSTLNKALQQANTVVGGQEAVLAKIVQNYQQLNTASKAAAKQQKALDNSLEDVRESLDKQNGALARAKTELTQLGVAGDKAEQAMRELGQAASGQLQTAFDRTRRAVLETKREWIQSSQEASRLAAAMTKIGPPTREQAEAFFKAKAGAAQAKQEYILQRETLVKLSRIMKETGGDVQVLAERQQRFVQVLREAGEQLNRLRGNAERAAQGYRTIGQTAAQAAERVGRTNSQLNRTGGAARSASSGVDQLSNAYRRLFGEQRRALSVGQRLRSEILALTTAYVGVFGALRGLGASIGAFQQIEAATSRLNAVFDNDRTSIGNEMEFIRRNADRLGVQFGVLADQYTKFAVSTKGTNLAGEETRRIFLRVAEAGRVNKLSIDQLRAIFVALSQIVSKGTFNQEELRQQLGDRLPGALQILADGLGVTTEELNKMIELGQVSSDALSKFADELERRFGGALPAALKTTTTEIGRFQNSLFQAAAAFAGGGFIQSFTELLRSLNSTLQSAEFISFLQRISAATGLLIDALRIATENFELLTIAASAFVGIRLAGFLTSLNWSGLIAGARNARVAIAGTATAMTAATGVAARAGVAFTTLGVGIRALLSATGVGLAITAVTTLLGLWITSADDATAAMIEHRKIVDAVADAYEKAKGEVDDWADRIENVTRVQAEASLLRLQEQLDNTREALSKPIINPLLDLEEVNDAISKFDRGLFSAEQFKTAITSIAESDESLIPLGGALSDLADQVIEARKRVEKAEAVIRVMAKTAGDADAVILGLKSATEGAGKGFKDAEIEAKKFQDALEGIKQFIPELAKDLKQLKDLAKLDALVADLGSGPRRIDDRTQELIDQARDAITGRQIRSFGESLGKLDSAAEAASKIIRRFEGRFIPSSFRDTDERGRPGALRIGFSSDTVTLADGSIKKVTAGMRINLNDGIRDLNRRIAQSIGDIRRRVGDEAFSNLNARQIGVLTSIAYNYGRLPESLVRAVQTGSERLIAQAIRALPKPGSILKKRRNEEAALFQQGTTPGEEQAAADSVAKKAEDAAKFTEELRQQVEQNNFDAEILGKTLLQREQMKAIREAEIAAQKVQRTLTKEERADILKSTEAKFKEKSEQEQVNLAKKAAREIEQQVNALLAKRTALEQQLKLARQEGDAGTIKSTEAELKAVNAELQAAIANATQMWQAIGGTAADTAITKLETAKIKANQFRTSAQTNLVDWKRVGDLFASGLTNAFDRFAQAVANGESVGKAAKEAFLQFASDFLRQIAQMIIKQAILNALQGFQAGGVGGIFGLFGTAHKGGVVGSKRVGSGNNTRRVHPGVFNHAPKFHGGGVAGLRPGDVPSILKRNEEVLTEDDPRNVLNGGLRALQPVGKPEVNLRNVNVFESADVLEQALRGRVGEEIFLNFIRDNPTAVQAAINEGS